MPKIDAAFIKDLLDTGENAGLDYKRDGFDSSGSTDEAKSKHVKAVLAMANFPQRADAFILFGVRETEDKRGEVVGTGVHLDDAKWQQLVNEKTNRPVEMSYSVVDIDGRNVGVLRIDMKQQRPIWLKEDFGRLRANAVHVRRGSSTVVLSPDDLIKIGASSANAECPELRLLLEGDGDADGTTVIAPRILVGKWAEWEERKPLRPDALATMLRVQDALLAPLGGPTKKDLAEWRTRKSLFRAVSLVIKNLGGATLKDPIATLTIPKVPGLVLDEDLPSKPRGLSALAVPRFSSQQGIEVREDQDAWQVVLRVRKIRPKDSERADFFVGCPNEIDQQWELVVHADNLADPIRTSFAMSIRPERTREWGGDDGDDEDANANDSAEPG